jgi:hypothetical protein
MFYLFRAVAITGFSPGPKVSSPSLAWPMEHSDDGLLEETQVAGRTKDLPKVTANLDRLMKKGRVT